MDLVVKVITLSHLQHHSQQALQHRSQPTITTQVFRQASLTQTAVSQAMTKPSVVVHPASHQQHLDSARSLNKTPLQQVSPSQVLSLLQQLLLGSQPPQLLPHSLQASHLSQVKASQVTVPSHSPAQITVASLAITNKTFSKI